MSDPYEHSEVKSTRLSFQGCWCCHFCGALVLPEWWDDHVSWHRALEVQAGAVIAASLERIALSLEGSKGPMDDTGPE
jgi:hypothetical protein